MEHLHEEEEKLQEEREMRENMVEPFQDRTEEDENGI